MPVLACRIESKSKKTKLNIKKDLKLEPKVNIDVLSKVIETKPKPVKINTKKIGSDKNTSIKKVNTDNSILNVGEPFVSSEVVREKDKCEICELNIVGHINELLCFRCSKYFHEECVPLFYENRIPVIGPYVCHICYHLHQTSSSSDNEE